MVASDRRISTVLWIWFFDSGSIFVLCAGGLSAMDTIERNLFVQINSVGIGPMAVDGIT